ncbi:MAG TPA: amidohydrolase family protein [Candidatus Limnocylindrales bacterium]|nr:amidohydrolase family protein [Candidatus Limnocylindrales bacterium]
MTQDLLVRGRWVITGATAADKVVADGAVLVEGGRIGAVGPWDELRAAHPALPVVGSGDDAILPGFVAAHHHGNAATALQQGISDDLLELWLLAMRTARSLDPELRALLTATRLLRGGVTAAIEMTELRSAPAQAAASLARRVAAYERSGIRMAVAVGVVGRGGLVPDPDLAAFLESLPSEDRARAAAVAAEPAPMDDDEYLGVVADARRAAAASPRVDVWYGPPGPQWVSESLIRRIADSSAADGARIQIHVAESRAEGLLGQRHHGRPMTLHLRDLGLLSERCSFAHGVWLADEEIEVLAATGVSVAHNPSSNLRLRAGVARLHALLAAGVTVGIGLDANGLADDDDMLAEARLALRLARSPRVAEPVPSLAAVFAAATTGGARILGRGGDLGRIAPGYAADLVLVDPTRATWPWVAPDVDPRELVLLRAHGDDVRTVLVDGEIVLRDRQPTRFDLDEVVAETVARLDATAVDPATRALGERLRPHLARFLKSVDRPG